MSKDLTDTEELAFYLTKKDREQIKSLDELTEIYTISFKKDRGPLCEPDECYMFFTDFIKAYKQHKLFGPNRSYMKRLFTDDDNLIAMASKNTEMIPVEDEVELEDSDDESFVGLSDLKKEIVYDNSDGSSYCKCSEQEEEELVKPVEEFKDEDIPKEDEEKLLEMTADLVKAVEKFEALDKKVEDVIELEKKRQKSLEKTVELFDQLRNAMDKVYDV